MSGKRLYQIPYGKTKTDGIFGMTEGFLNVSAVNRRAAEQQVRRKTGMEVLR